MKLYLIANRIMVVLKLLMKLPKRLKKMLFLGNSIPQSLCLTAALCIHCLKCLLKLISENFFLLFFADDDGELRLVASHSARGWRAKRPLRRRRRAPPPSLSWARATSYAVYSVSSLNGRPLSNFILFLSYIMNATGFATKNCQFYGLYYSNFSCDGS